MRVSKNSVIFNRVNSGAELLFHSKVVAKVDKLKGEVVLKLGSFKTPTAIGHVQGFLDKNNIRAAVSVKKNEVWLSRNGKSTIGDEHTFIMNDNET
jgi:hypothetical protein